MNKVVFITLFALFIMAIGDGTKYSDIADYTNDFEAKVEYKSTKTDSIYEKYVDCSNNETLCERQLLSFDDDAVIRMIFTLPSSLEEINYRKKAGKSNLKAPSKMKIKLCYDAESTDLRAWREADDTIEDDKRCKRKFADTFSLEAGEMSKEYNLPSDTPGARYFLTLLVLCDYEDGNDNTFCAMDTTGSLSEFGINSNGREKSDNTYVKTEVMDSVSTGLVVGVVIMSFTALTLLVSYFIYDNFIKKNV